MGAFDTSFAAGGMQQSLDDIIKQKFLQQIESRRAQESQQQMGLQARGQDITAGGQKLAHDRWLQDNATKKAETDAANTERNNQAFRGAQMVTDPTTSAPTRLAIQYRNATGENAPSELLKTPEGEAPPQPVMRINPRTGQMEKIGEAPKGAHFVNEPPPRQPAAPDHFAANTGMKLADDYTRDAKDFTTMNTAMRRVVASANAPSAAGDMALLYSYMKILDPNSVVRESEFAQAAQSGSLPQQVQAAATKLMNGQRLTPEQRADFVNRAQALYGEAKATNATVRQSYTDRAKKFGVDPSLVFTDIGEPGTVGGGPVAMVAPDGRPLSVPPEKVEEMLRAGAKKR